MYISVMDLTGIKFDHNKVEIGLHFILQGNPERTTEMYVKDLFNLITA